MKHLKIFASVSYNDDTFRNEFSFLHSCASGRATHEFTIDYRISSLDPSVKFFRLSRIKDLRSGRFLTHDPITISTGVPYDVEAIDNVLEILGLPPYIYCIHQVLKYVHIYLFNLK